MHSCIIIEQSVTFKIVINLQVWGRRSHVLSIFHYRRRWLLSVGAYSFSQQENKRLTANMRLIGIPLITMSGVIIINAIACEALNKYTIKPTAK